MSNIPKAFVGSWINWQEGKFWGLTYTTDQQTASLLTTVIALYTQAALGHLFGLIRFFVFYFRSSPSAKHGLFHQHQAILRNRGGVVSMLFDSIRLLFAWKAKGLHTIRRTLSFMLFAGIVAAIIYAGTLASTRISAMPDQILLQSDPRDCGHFDTVEKAFNLTATGSDITKNDIILSQIVLEAARSAGQCYNRTELSRSSGCNVYGKKLVQWSKRNSDSCPINDGPCERGVPSVTLDSGYIDTLDHLGINTPSSEKVYMKLEQSCSPLNLSAYVVPPRPAPNSPLARAFYGDASLVGSLRLGPMNTPAFLPENNVSVAANETVVFGYWSKGGTVTPLISTSQYAASNYILDSQVYYIRNYTYHSGTFTPKPDIPWLMRSTKKEAQYSLMSLSQGNLFDQPVKDPWFKADSPLDNGYVSDQTIRVVGCSLDRYICPRADPADDGCVPLLTGFSAQDYGSFIEEHGASFSAGQRKLIRRVMWILGSTSVHTTALVSKAQGLLANARSLAQVSEPLPDDQWIRELEHMFSTVMIHIQLNSISFARNVLGLENQKAAPFANETAYCDNQVIVSASADYKSFSVAGVSLILVIGFFVFVLDMTIPSLMKRLPPQSFIRRYRLADWDFHHYFQLERWTYEMNECGKWSGQDKAPTADRVGKFVTPLSIFDPDLLMDGGVDEQGRFLRGSDDAVLARDGAGYKMANTASRLVRQGSL